MKHTVLFVDDDLHVTDGLKRAFRKEPFHALTANSAEEAYQILTGEPVDVVVSDQKMPRISGTDFFSVLRRKFPDTVRIMLTGEANLDTAKKAINDGEVYRFFTKPCNEVELAVTIHQAIKQKDLMAEARQLLKMYKQQNSLIKRLEKSHPQLYEVERDEEGAIVLEEEAANNLDMDKLLEEIRTETKKHMEDVEE